MTRLESVRSWLVGALVVAGLFLPAREGVPQATATGPLRVHPTNPRYFADASGKAVYLTGSHHWMSLQDRTSRTNPTVFDLFDYPRYLNFLQQYNHNFIRLWIWEHASWEASTTTKVQWAPLPYLRPGPGTALDGGLKFDLNRFNQAFFDRLRACVLAARDRGIYVSVMLFEGWSNPKDDKPGNPWPGHPFNKSNNINGIDGDPNGSNKGREVHTLQVPAVTRLHEAFARKVVDTVNDLDNVLYEIGNEIHITSVAWQHHMIGYLQTYEASKPKRHLVGMTSIEDTQDATPLYASTAEWISPAGGGSAPVANDGRKVVLHDTDHIFGVGGSRDWVWKTFVRGNQPIYMDTLWDPTTIGTTLEDARKAMGYTLNYARRMNLAGMTPRGNLTSTAYGLVNPGAEYLIYKPSNLSATFTVDLTGATGTLNVEWFNPATGVAQTPTTVQGGAVRSFTTPFGGDAVLYLKGGGGTSNQAPAVNVGPDETITLPAGASLSATVSDDGRPSPPGALTLTWSKISGPGTVSFANAAAASTSASFIVPGTYVLRLTATDSVLSGADDVTITVNGGSLVGKALRFTSDTQYVDFPTPVYLGSRTNSLTAEAWVRMETLKTAIVISQDDGSGGYFKVFMNPAEYGSRIVGIVAQTTGAPGNLSGRGYESVYSATSLRTDTWYHVALVLDRPAARVRIYLNGVKELERDAAHVGSWDTSANRLAIGNDQLGGWGGDWSWPGVIDEVRVYSKALADADIAAHYDGGRGVSGRPEPGLVAGWHLDEGAGTTANDSSGNGHRGTLKAGIQWVDGLVPSTTAPPPPPPAGDSDGDGLPDAWENATFGGLGQTAGGDFEGDGITNLQEYTGGLDPTSSDQDGNGVLDGDDDWDGDGTINRNDSTPGTPPRPSAAPSGSSDGDGGCGALGLEAVLLTVLLRRMRRSGDRR